MKRFVALLFVAALMAGCMSPPPVFYPTPTPQPQPQPPVPPVIIPDDVASWDAFAPLAAALEEGTEISRAEVDEALGTARREYTQPVAPFHTVVSFFVKDEAGSGIRNVHAHFLDGKVVRFNVR